MKLESLQKQSESALSLHLVSCIQVLRQLGRTPGADGAGAGAEDGAAGELGDEAGVEVSGWAGELGEVAGAELWGAMHLVQMVEIEVLVTVETLWETTGVGTPAEVTVLVTGQVVTVV